ncbi:dienelactone hydrolase family protein [Altererythrobacter sp. ZODW24]|uniref:dienelactone hydrolase family protein n=1 Tax=Altererythrobacter sp. ZODW24 TaxID=2185142 RepID=UPI000DF7AC12|nr:dienelactone hydrolase family protein [Altererythrobacter sp. ZODW24]
MTTTAKVPTLDSTGQIPVYVARPEGKAKAAIIVVPEIFGVNPGIRKKCDDWAAKGYAAAAPDIFWRFSAGEELNPDIEEEFSKALENMGQYDADLGVQDIEALIRWLKDDGGVSKVGLVGFCLGGRMAYLAAARTDIDASVGYYGVMIDQMLGESHAIANPLMLHIPEEDHFVDKAAQVKIHEGLDDHHKVTLHDYPGMDHGFATESGDRRDEENAQLADKRTEDFFAESFG